MKNTIIVRLSRLTGVSRGTILAEYLDLLQQHRDAGEANPEALAHTDLIALYVSKGFNLGTLSGATTPLDEAAKCALVSMDSTLKSNLSVGLPLDLLVYRNGDLKAERIVCIDEKNPYFKMIHDTWGQRLREVFEGIEHPEWSGDGAAAEFPLMVESERYETMRKITHPGEKIV